jgi:hypothetical protein
MRTNIRFCKDPVVSQNFRGLIETEGSDMNSYAAPAVNNQKYINKIKKDVEYF